MMRLTASEKRKMIVAKWLQEGDQEEPQTEGKPAGGFPAVREANSV